jgi:hypothetical protein
MENSATSSADTQPTCFRCRQPTKTGGAADTAICTLCDLADEALGAFWEVIVRRFPEAKYGDLSPGRTVALDDTAREAIEEWIRNNVPNQPHENAH